MKKIVLFIFVQFLLLFGLLWQMPDGRFHIYFLDIGQGDSVLIVTPEGHQILVDGGPAGEVMNELAEVMPFFDKTIDMIVLSHPHADHMDGLIEVLERYQVDKVLMTGASYGGSHYEEFLGELDDEEVILANADSDFVFGSVSFDILYPFESVVGQDYANINNSSISMMVEYGDVRILLTGDLEEEGELELGGLDLKADIFKAGHHGSRTSSTPFMLSKVRPEIVVIQSGKDNKFGHPHAETLRNFERFGVREVRRNDLEGRIEFSY